MKVEDIANIKKVVDENGVKVYNGHTFTLLKNFNEILVNNTNFSLQKELINHHELYHTILKYHIGLTLEDDNDNLIITYLFILFKNRWPEVSKLFPIIKDIKIKELSTQDKREYIFNAVWHTDIKNSDLLIYLMDRSKLENLKSELYRRYISYE